MSEPKTKKKKKSRKDRNKRYDKYIYTLGDTYPGVTGHKECFGRSEFDTGVPAYMGWLWTIGDGHNKPRRGWRPGALGKSILKLMQLRAPDTGLSDPTKKKDIKPKTPRRIQKSPTSFDDNEEEDEDIPPRAALHVNRQGDVITVTVNPLRRAESIGEGEDPFMECDPIVFRIVQKRTPEEIAKKAQKKINKEKRQLENEIRSALKNVIGDICQCAYLDVYCNDLSAIDNMIEKIPEFNDAQCTCVDGESSAGSSESAWDIEYTPPFGNAGPIPLPPDKVHTETQYVETDWVVLKKPIPVSSSRGKRETRNSSVKK